MEYREATLADVAVLGALNQQLDVDQGSRNRRSLAELEARMSQRLQDGHQAILFTEAGNVVAYALYRRDIDAIHLVHFVVERRYRRQSLGRQAMHILLTAVWPPDWRVTLNVLTHNHRGQAFWRLLGFSDYLITMEMLPRQPAEPH